MTGVNNRRSFHRHAGPLPLLAQRHNRPLSAAMLDIDFFKKVNDAHGHGAGDEALCGVAEVLVNAVRASDVVGPGPAVIQM